MSKIAVIDFDGTIAEHRFPDIGPPLPGAFEVMKEMQEAGWKLILWTCRENCGHRIDGQHLTRAVEFCKKHGIEFDAINEAIPHEDFRENSLMRKPYAKVHIDDKNLGGFPGWETVRELLLGS